MEKPEKKEDDLIGRIDELGAKKKAPLHSPAQEKKWDEIRPPGEQAENDRWLD